MRVVFRSGSPLKRAGGKKVVAVGVFDGVHRGHRKILRLVTRDARARGLASAVVTFAYHPSHLFNPDEKIPALTCLAHKISALRQAGVDFCYVIHFDRAFARIQPDDFVRDILIKEIGMISLYVGEDFAFGRDARGDTATLARLAKSEGFRLHTVRRLKIKNRVVSSTLIRALIRRGKLDQARQFLGRPVSFLGQVIRGERRGRTLGFPTANIHPFHEVLAPTGIYTTETFLDGRLYPSVTYIGFKPTFSKNPRVRNIEVFLMEIRRDLYGKKVEVRFVKKIRDDKKFPSKESLILQMQEDLLAAQKILRSRRHR